MVTVGARTLPLLPTIALGLGIIEYCCLVSPYLHARKPLLKPPRNAQPPKCPSTHWASATTPLEIMFPELLSSQLSSQQVTTACAMTRTYGYFTPFESMVCISISSLTLHILIFLESRQLQVFKGVRFSLFLPISTYMSGSAITTPPNQTVQACAENRSELITVRGRGSHIMTTAHKLNGTREIFI